MSRYVEHRETLKQPLVVSSAAHLMLIILALFNFPLSHQRGEPWGGPGGGAIQVNAVRSLPGVPLPRPPVVAENLAASESPSLYQQEEPKKGKEELKAKRKEERATELPRFGEEPKKRPPARQAARREEPQALPPGAIPTPSGQGGPAALPYTAFQTGGGEGGLSFGAGGTFGGRYPWYVESVRRRISGNWLLAGVDPGVRWAPRAVMSFEVLRDGNIVNIQMLQSSGVPSVDRSCLRAIRDSSPLDRLPSDYPGDKVYVEFWFDFRRQ
ncbi:MAG TPA: TonB family protein [Candidatus Xenobia bacterium]|nr:TonB family protein [Candidatus Xenobia bacterium]